MAKTKRRRSKNKSPKLLGVVKKRVGQTGKEQLKKQLLFNVNNKTPKRNRKNASQKNISTGRHIKYATGEDSLNIRITCSNPTNELPIGGLLNSNVNDLNNTERNERTTSSNRTLNDMYQTIDCVQDGDENNDVIFVCDDSDVIFVESRPVPPQTTQDVILIEDDTIVEVPRTPAPIGTAVVNENSCSPSPIASTIPARIKKGTRGFAQSTPIQGRPVVQNCTQTTKNQTAKNQRDKIQMSALSNRLRSKLSIGAVNAPTSKTVAVEVVKADIVNSHDLRSKTGGKSGRTRKTRFSPPASMKDLTESNPVNRIFGKNIETNMVRPQNVHGKKTESNLVNTGPRQPNAESVPGYKLGSNFLNAGAVRTQGLRPIFIDGSNVAMGHSNGKFFSVKGLQICINYFKLRGHEVTAIVPLFRKKFGQNSNTALLQLLENEKTVMFTPSRRVNGKNIVPYDDRYIVLLAQVHKGIVVSSDNFRDLLEEDPSLLETIESRVLTPTWLKDMIIFPTDPLGRHGPKLDDFLKFP